MKLYLLRHAKVCVAQGVCYGRTDLDSDPLATREAARAVADVLPQGTIVWTSPLRRTMQLAAALISLRPDLSPATPEPRLVEMDFGEWEMVPWQNIPKSALDLWVADFAQHRFGGAESAQDMLLRVAQALEDARALPANQLLWVTHGGVISALRHLCARPGRRSGSAQDWPAHGVEPGQWVVMDV